MKLNLRVLVAGLLLIGCTGFFGCSKNEKQVSQKEEVTTENVSENPKVVASTSWTAAFADLAGIDEVEVIAPASMRHPPEYEITVSDIQKINESDFFIYAGFERMMKTLGDAVENVSMIKISCNNSIETVTSSAMTIAEVFGTQKICDERLMEYINKIYEGKNLLKEKNLEGAKVMCNANQTYLAKELGFEIIETFGPNPVTSEQIKFAGENKIDFIIDNVHNPVAQPLVEVNPDAKYVIWRNFPERIERNALLNVISENINMLVQ